MVQVNWRALQKEACLTRDGLGKLIRFAIEHIGHLTKTIRACTWVNRRPFDCHCQHSYRLEQRQIAGDLIEMMRALELKVSEAVEGIHHIVNPTIVVPT